MIAIDFTDLLKRKKAYAGASDKKIKCFDFTSSLQNEDYNLVLKRIVPQVDMAKIGRIIDGTPFLSNL